MARPATAALAALLLLAGCGTDGGATITAAGTPASVDADAVDEAGYEQAGSTERTLNATLTVTVQGDIEGRASEDVSATIPVATYRRATDAGPAVVAVAASPSVEIVENPPKSADPLGTLSTAELAAFLQPTYAEVADLSEAGTATVGVLGDDADLVGYRGTAVRDGRRVDVAVHVLRARRGGDVVTAVAVHPAAVDERDRVATLLAGIDR